MPTKETRPDTGVIAVQPPLVNLKVLERFLRILTWQVVILLALMVLLIVVLFELASRPQAGRYQVILGKDEIVVFDTATLRVVPIKPQQISEAAAGNTTTPGVPSTPENPPPATPETK